MPGDRKQVQGVTEYGKEHTVGRIPLASVANSIASVKSNKKHRLIHWAMPDTSLTGLDLEEPLNGVLR